ncbi:FkbM family methyltransferase [Planktomarina temperata]|nr:FkbM family methyltransferase [Planktomarina temperata]
MVQGKRKWGIGPINDFIEQHGLREKFDALTPPKVATVAYRDASFKFYIPDAMTDKMQLAPLLGWYHERSLLEAFHSVVDSNGTICDLGANFGSHTVYFAAIMKARRVHSFEPQAHLIDVIKKTLELNQIDNVTLHHAVAGAKLGKAHLKRTHVENSGMAEFRPGAGDLPVDMLPVMMLLARNM